MTAGNLRLCAIGLLAMASLSADAKSVDVLAFSFSVPDAWYVEGRGGDKFFGMGGKDPDSPPQVLAEACVPSSTKSCVNIDKRGWPPCDGAAAAIATSRDGIKETRYLCPTEVVQGRSMLFGTSLYEIEDALLVVTYVASDGDMAPREFMESLSRSVHFRRPTTAASMTQLPTDVREALLALCAPCQFADYDAPWNATDVLKEGRPQRHLRRIEQRQGGWLIEYDHGGRGLHRHTVIFETLAAVHIASGSSCNPTSEKKCEW